MSIDTFESTPMREIVNHGKEVILITLFDYEIYEESKGRPNLIPLIMKKGLKCSGITNPVPLGTVESWVDYNTRTTYIRQVI